MMKEHSDRREFYSGLFLPNPAYVDPKGYQFPTEVEAHAPDSVSERKRWGKNVGF